MSKIENTTPSSGVRDIEPPIEVRPQSASALSHYQSIEQRPALERTTTQEEELLRSGSLRSLNPAGGRETEGFRRVRVEAQIENGGEATAAKPPRQKIIEAPPKIKQGCRSLFPTPKSQTR